MGTLFWIDSYFIKYYILQYKHLNIPVQIKFLLKYNLSKDILSVYNIFTKKGLTDLLMLFELVVQPFFFQNEFIYIFPSIYLHCTYCTN
jgi:hypothetical protein